MENYMLDEKESADLINAVYENTNNILKSNKVLLADSQYVRIIQHVVNTTKEVFINKAAELALQNEENIAVNYFDFFSIFIRNIKNDTGEKFGSIVAEYGIGDKAAVLIKGTPDKEHDDFKKLTDKEMEDFKKDMNERIHKILKSKSISLPDSLFEHVLNYIVRAFEESLIIKLEEAFVEHGEKPIMINCGDFYTMIRCNEDDVKKITYQTGLKTKLLIKNDEVSENYVDN